MPANQFVALVADQVNGSSTWKPSCRLVATSNITLSGLQTIDSVLVVDGDRVLVTGQTSGAQNGVYNASSGTWSRAIDFIAGTALPSSRWRVREGTVNSNTDWTCTNTTTITVGSTAVTIVAGTSLPFTAVAPPTLTALTSSVGVNASELARRDHTHGHGVQTNTTLHALASTSAHGFMSATHKGMVDRLHVDVKAPAYGAVGDGVTDDTAAIQAAAAAVQAAGGGTLYFPPGTYLVFSGVLTSPLGDFNSINNVKVIAHGATLKLPAARDFTHLGFWPCLKFTTCSNIVVDGFTCIGGLLDQSAGLAGGLTLVDLNAGCHGLSMPFNRLSGAWTGLHSTDNAPPVAGHESTGISIGYLEVSGGTYGVNGQHSLHDMTIGYLRTTGVYRSLFMVGCHNVTAAVDSADSAGSHDVIFSAKDADVSGCHVRYIRKRDSAGITADVVGVFWQFIRTTGGPWKMTHCSTKLDVDLPSSANTLGTACQVGKYLSDSVTEDTTDRGYTLHDWSVSGRVDMNTRGAQAVILSPTDNWSSGEFASGINISDLVIRNNVAGTNAVWFNIARSLVGPMNVDNVDVGTNALEIFGRSGAGPHYASSDDLVRVGAVVCNNRHVQPGSGSRSNALQTGAGIHRIGGWGGFSTYVDETLMSLVARSASDYFGLGGTRATSGYLRGPSDYSVVAHSGLGGSDNNLASYDGADNALFGATSNAGSYIDSGSGGSHLRSGGSNFVSADTTNGFRAYGGGFLGLQVDSGGIVKFWAGASQVGQLASGGSDFLIVGGNLTLCASTPSYGGGVQVIFIGNRNTPPSTNPVGGGVLYCEAGALKYRGSSGTVTTLGPA